MRTIIATFSFNEPTGATGTLSNTAVYTADYNNDTDFIVWSSSNAPIRVTFSNTDGNRRVEQTGNA